MRSVARVVAVVATCLAASGCLFPDPPAPPRYFAAVLPPADAPRAPVAVRLGVVRSPLHLREQMTWRRSDVEYGFYEQRRWAELPATYVEQALARDLFGNGATAVAVPANAPVLTAEVRAFEEVLSPVHEARVAVAVELADARCMRLRRTFAATRPLDGDDPAAVARGVGEALDDVAHEVGDAVRRALAERRACGA